MDGLLYLGLLLLLLLPGERRATRPTPERLARLDARIAQRDELQRLVRERKRVEAIRLYRRETGASLLEAKVAVDQLGRSVA